MTKIEIKTKKLDIELEIVDSSNNKITVKIDEEELLVLRDKLNSVLKRYEIKEEIK